MKNIHTHFLIHIYKKMSQKFRKEIELCSETTKF